MRVRAHLTAALFGLGTLSCGSSAQVPPAVDQLRRPSDAPLPSTEPEQRQPRLKLPAEPAPNIPSGPSLSQGAQVVARAFRFVGNTVFADAELQAIAAPFVGRALGNLELDDLRIRITRHYIAGGYINSGAVIPDQDVSDGVIVMRVVEGRLSDILIGGANRYDPQFLRNRIGLAAQGVLNVNRLQEHMQLLLQDPLIERIAAELAPGVEPGDAVLRADVTSAPLFLGGLTFSNERSPSVGADQAEGLLAVRNLFGRGEVLTLLPAYSEGLRDIALGLTIPVTTRGTSLSLRIQRTLSRIVEAPLDQLDIAARSKSVELGLNHPLLTTPRRTLSASMAIAKRETQSTFLGLPSPFIPGAPDGRTTVSVLRAGLEGVDRSPERVIAGRAQISHGIDAFGATVAGGGTPDSRFTTLLAQFQWVQRMPAAGSHLVIRAELQHSNDALPGPEKYSIGGAESVRGYRKDIFVRDSGWLASIEYRHLLGHLPWFGGAAASQDGAVHLALFADTARAWDRDSTAGVARIAGIGPGLRWEPVAGMSLQAYYGKSLTNVVTPTRTLQDRGIHLRIGFTRPF